MEYNEILDKLEGQVLEAGKKIEHLTTAVQNISLSPESANSGLTDSSTLNRIETKIDIIAQSDNTEYVDLFLGNFKSSLEEKNEFLAEKLHSIEALNLSLSQKLTDENLAGKVEELKGFISQAFDEITNIQKEIAEVARKSEENKLDERFSQVIEELRPLLQKIDNSYAEAADKITAQMETLNPEKDILPQLETLNGDISEIKSYISDVGEVLKTTPFNQAFNEIMESFSSFDTKTNGLLDNVRELEAKTIEIQKQLETMPDIETFDAIINNLKMLEFKSTEIQEQLTAMPDNNVFNDITEGIRVLGAKTEEIQELIVTTAASDNAEELMNEIKGGLVALNSKLIEGIKLSFSSDDIGLIKEAVTTTATKVHELKELSKTLSGNEGFRNDVMYGFSKLSKDTEFIRGEIYNIQAKVEDFDTILQSAYLNDEIALINKKLTELQGHVVAQTSNEKIAAAIHALYVEIQKLNTKVDEDLNKNSGSTEIEENLSDITDSLSQINGQILKVQNDIYLLEDIRENLYPIEEKLNEIFCTIVSASGDSGLLDRMESVQGAVAELTSSINKEDLDYRKDLLEQINHRTSQLFERTASLTQDEMDYRKQLLEQMDNKVSGLFERTANLTQEEMAYRKDLLEQINSRTSQLFERTASLTQDEMDYRKQLLEQMDDKVSNLFERTTSLTQDEMDYRKQLLEQIDNKVTNLFEKASEDKPVRNNDDLRDEINYGTKLLAKEIEFLKGEIYNINESVSSSMEILKDNALKNQLDLIFDELKFFSSNSSDSLNEVRNQLTREFDFLKGDLYTSNSGISGLNDKIELLSTDNDTIKNISTDAVNKLASLGLKVESINENIGFIKNNSDNSAGNISAIEVKVDAISSNIASSGAEISNVSEKAEIITSEIEAVKSSLNNTAEKILNINEKVDELVELTGTGALSDKVNEIAEKFDNFDPDRIITSVNEDFKAQLDIITQDFGQIQETADSTFDKIASLTVASKDIMQDLKDKSFEQFEEIHKQLTEMASKKEDVEVWIQKAFENIDGLSDSVVRSTETAENQISIINSNFHNFRLEFDKISEKFIDMKNEISDISTRTNKLILTSSQDSDLLKTNIEDFKSVITEIKEEAEQKAYYLKGVEDSMSNLAYSVNSSSAVSEKKLNELIKKFEKVNSFSSKTLDNSEVVKTVMLTMADWIDSAGNMIQDTNNTVSDLSRTNRSTEIVRHLKEVKLLLDELKSAPKEDDSSNAEVIDQIDDLKYMLKEGLSDSKYKLKAVQDDQEKQSDELGNINEEIQNVSRMISSLEMDLRDKLMSSGLGDDSFSETLDLSFNQLRNDVSKELRRISNRFDKFENQLERMEDRIESLAVPSIEKDPETKSVLEFIAGQVTAMSQNTKAQAMMVKKMESLERRVAMMDGNFNRMLSMLEQD